MKEVYKKYADRFENHVAKNIIKRKNNELTIGYKARIKPNEKLAEKLEKTLKKIKAKPETLLDELLKIQKMGISDGTAMLTLMEIVEALRLYERVRFAWANKRLDKTKEQQDLLKRYGRKLGSGVKLVRYEKQDIKDLLKDLGVPKDARIPK